MRGKIFTFAALVALVPSALNAQTQGQGRAHAEGRAEARAEKGSDASAEKRADARAESRANLEAAGRVDAALEKAISAGIPVALLESKVAEGQAKGVAMARIAAAVEHRLDVLTRVQTAMQGRGATASELQAGAVAVDAGVSVEAIGKVHESAPSGERARAVSVLAELVAEGKAPEHALIQVQAALARGGDALVRLGSGAQGAGQAVVQVGANAKGGVNAGTAGVDAGVDVVGKVIGGARGRGN